MSNRADEQTYGENTPKTGKKKIWKRVLIAYIAIAVINFIAGNRQACLAEECA